MCLKWVVIPKRNSKNTHRECHSILRWASESGDKVGQQKQARKSRGSLLARHAGIPATGSTSSVHPSRVCAQVAAYSRVWATAGLCVLRGECTGAHSLGCRTPSGIAPHKAALGCCPRMLHPAGLCTPQPGHAGAGVPNHCMPDLPVSHGVAGRMQAPQHARPRHGLHPVEQQGRFPLGQGSYPKGWPMGAWVLTPG